MFSISFHCWCLYPHSCTNICSILSSPNVWTSHVDSEQSAKFYCKVRAYSHWAIAFVIATSHFLWCLPSIKFNVNSTIEINGTNLSNVAIANTIVQCEPSIRQQWILYLKLKTMLAYVVLFVASFQPEVIISGFLLIWPICPILLKSQTFIAITRNQASRVPTELTKINL